MARDRSLDEFVREESSESEDDADESAAEGDDATDPASESVAGGTPAVPTMSWHPDGVGCESCGRAVDQRWSDDGQLVCRECKDW